MITQGISAPGPLLIGGGAGGARKDLIAEANHRPKQRTQGKRRYRPAVAHQ